MIDLIGKYLTKYFSILDIDFVHYYPFLIINKNTHVCTQYTKFSVFLFGSLLNTVSEQVPKQYYPPSLVLSLILSARKKKCLMNYVEVFYPIIVHEPIWMWALNLLCFLYWNFESNIEILVDIQMLYYWCDLDSGMIVDIFIFYWIWLIDIWYLYTVL